MKAEEYLSSRYYSFLNGLENKEQIDSVCLAMEEYAAKEVTRNLLKAAIVHDREKKQEAIEIKDLLQDCFNTADISNLFTNEWINGYARALSDVEYHINQKIQR